MHKKYDLYIPLGSFCLNAMTLNKLKLRYCSLPFDWLTPVKLNFALELIKNNFNNFISKDKLALYGINHGIYIGYKNIDNGLVFLHDFTKYETFEQQYQKIEEKYSRRISRLYEQLNIRHNILCLYFHNEHDDAIGKVGTIEDIKSNFELLKTIENNNKIDLLYIILSKNSGKGTEEIYNDNGLTIVRCYKSQENEESLKAYNDNISSYLKRYCLSFDLKRSVHKTFRLFLLGFLPLIPNKKIRRKLKSRIKG